MDKFRVYLKLLFKKLASMQSAIYLLLMVGAVSALGTFIPQGQPPAFYMEHYAKPLAYVINGLGFSNLYRVWWFIFLNILLSLSILTCAYQRLRRGKRRSILASLFMHLALVFIVVGAIWSLGLSHDKLVEVEKGESVSLSDYGFSAGQLTLDDFWIDYYPDYQPRQYTSKLTLQGYKGKDYKREIYVNRPFKAGSLKIYQSNWGWLIHLSDMGSPAGKNICLKEGERHILNVQEGIEIQALFLPDFDDSERGIHSKSPIPNNPHAWLTVFQQGRIIDMAIITPGEEVELASYLLRFDSYNTFSGLHVKQDAGVYMVFAGFILLLGGIALRYFIGYWDKRRDRQWKTT